MSYFQSYFRDNGVKQFMSKSNTELYHCSLLMWSEGPKPLYGGSPFAEKCPCPLWQGDPMEKGLGLKIAPLQQIF